MHGVSSPACRNEKLQAAHLPKLASALLLSAVAGTGWKVIKACALLDQEAALLRCLQRLQSLLDTYSDERQRFCSKRKHQQQQKPGATSESPSSAPTSRSARRALTVPAAAPAGSIVHWFKRPVSAAAGEDANIDAGSSSSAGQQDSLMATALVNMKYYLLNAPLAVRVCTATSNSQVSRGFTTNLGTTLCDRICCGALR